MIHADEVVAPREVMDDDGVVHHYDEVLAGEAMEGGPVMLSWADVRDGAASRPTGLQRRDPRVRARARHGRRRGRRRAAAAGAAARRAWLARADARVRPLLRTRGCGHDTVLDPYGAEAPDEFFAVAVRGVLRRAARRCKEEQPALYRLFVAYFRQDPARCY